MSKGWLYGVNKLKQLSLAYNKVSFFPKRYKTLGSYRGHSLWFIMIPHNFSWFLMIPHDSSWFLMIPHDSSRFLTIPQDPHDSSQVSGEGWREGGKNFLKTVACQLKFNLKVFLIRPTLQFILIFIKKILNLLFFFRLTILRTMVGNSAESCGSWIYGEIWSRL